jgi:hypothetical protein
VSRVSGTHTPREPREPVPATAYFRMIPAVTHTAEQPETIPAVDAVAVALVAAFVSLAVGGLTASVTAWSAHKTSKTAREGRIDQRRADAYVHVLTIVEREGHWCEAWVANFGHYKGYSHEDQYELDEFVRPPEPEVTDRATTAALLAAIGSSTVRDCHAAWRAAADVLAREVRLIHHGLSLEPMDPSLPRSRETA